MDNVFAYARLFINSDANQDEKRAVYNAWEMLNTKAETPEQVFQNTKAAWNLISHRSDSEFKKTLRVLYIYAFKNIPHEAPAS